MIFNYINYQIIFEIILKYNLIKILIIIQLESIYLLI